MLEDLFGLLSSLCKSSIYTKAINILFIVYAFLLPISSAFTVHSAPYLFLFLWILEGNIKSKVQSLFSVRAIQFLYIFILINLLSFMWSDNITEAIHVFKYYLGMTFILSILYTSLKKEYLPYIIFAFLSSMFISEILSYGIFFEWWQFRDVLPTNPSPFMHHIRYSIFLVVTIFLLLNQISNKNSSTGVRIFEIAFLLSAVTNLFINGGRTGQIAFIFSAIVFSLIYFKNKIQYVVLTLVLVFSIFTIAYNFSPTFNQRAQAAINDIKRIQNNDLSSSWGNRIAMKIVAFDVIKKSYLMGEGIGDGFDVYVKNLETEKFKKYRHLKKFNHVHDQYMQILLEIGLIGLLSFLLFIGSLYFEKFDSRIDKATAYAIFTLFVFSFFTDVFFRNFTTALLAFMIGYFLVKDKFYKQNMKDGES